MTATLFTLLPLLIATLAPQAPDVSKPYDLKRLKLGTVSTVVIVLESTCASCFAPMDFYKSLMKLPAMDGTKRRVLVVAMDGVWPVKDKCDAAGFVPHRLTSGPYPDMDLPGVKTAPAILVLDAKGKQRGVWVGPFTAEKRNAIVAAVTAR